MITRDDWDNLTPDEQFLIVTGIQRAETVCADLLASIPECPKHGACINHAIQWVRRAQGLDSAFVREAWCCQDEPPVEQGVT